MILQPLYESYMNACKQKSDAVNSIDRRLLHDLNSGRINEYIDKIVKEDLSITNGSGILLNNYTQKLDEAIERLKSNISRITYIHVSHFFITTTTRCPTVYVNIKVKNPEYIKAIELREKDNTLQKQDSEHNVRCGIAKNAYINEKQKMLDLLHKHNLFLETKPLMAQQDKEIETLYNLLKQIE